MKNQIQKFDLRAVMVVALCLGAFAPSLVQASDPPVNSIPYRKAKSIALKARHGKIKNFEQRQWKGIWVFDFNILGDDQVLHEVVVEATTGKILMGAAKKGSKKHKKPTAVPTTAGLTPVPTPK
jgi:hypothetical protein